MAPDLSNPDPSKLHIAPETGSVASTTVVPVAPAAAQGQVDTHFHVFNRGGSVPGARYTPAYAAEIGAWQTQARAVGVTHGVLVQTSFMGIDNRLLLAQLAAHRQTLRGVAVVAPDAPGPMLADLHAQGVRGIRLNLAGQSHDMTAWAAATAVWDTLLQLGWHVELHTDNGRLPAVLSALPLDLPLVLDHFARPLTASLNDTSVMAVRARRLRSGAAMHVKLSAPYRLAAGLCPVELAKLWQGELGLHALLWGSDWPFTNHEAANEYVALHASLPDWLQGDAAALEAVLSHNPARLYGFSLAPAA